MVARRWVLLLVSLVLLQGCLSQPAEHRGDDGEDIRAPPPGPPPEEIDLVEPADPDETYRVRGRVLAADGRPAAGAEVWVESVDLRQPVNNVAAYLETRDATRVVAGADGSFAMRLEGGFYHITFRAPGHLPTRLSPHVPEEGLVEMEARLIPAGTVEPIAHRGASFYAPENTYAAVEKAILLGARMVEIDVRLAADGSVVVIHDKTLDRTTNGAGPVIERRADEMIRLDAGSWFHPSFRGEPVPTLETILRFTKARNATAILDVKADPGRVLDLEEALAETVRAVDARDHALIADFSERAVERCADRGDLRCALISRGPGTGPEVVDRAATLNASALMLQWDLVDKETVARADQHGLDLYVWTVNHEVQWDRLIDLGVDGILTDRPGFLIGHLVERATGQDAV